MAKILSFRNKGDSTSDQEFLTDGNQTLSFRRTEDGGISLGNLNQTDTSDLFPDPHKDWSNQELANLFRVKQLLSGANVPVETDRGVTDEGDPWFVFCYANGEVFIHLCRIGDLYFLDSPNVRRPLRGADFDELIADFTNQALPPQVDTEKTELRVIRLERGGKVRLHPSAMLAALIWTLFLASEELVLLAPETAELDNDMLIDLEGMFAGEVLEGEMNVDPFQQDMDQEMIHSVKHTEADTEYAAPDAQGQMRESMLQQQGLAIHNNAFTMGLSTIAIAMGFMSETVLLDNQRKVLEALEELSLAKYRTEGQQTAEVDIPALEGNSDLLAMLADFLGLDLSLNTHIAEQVSTERQQELAELSAEAQASKEVIDVSTASLDVIREKADVSEHEVQTGEEIPQETQDDVTPVEPTLAAVTAQRSVPGSLSEIIQTSQLIMEEFQLGDTTIKTSFDMSETDSFAIFDLIDAAGDQRNTNFQEFDVLAQRLIDFLEAKDGELGIIELENEIIMIDLTAVTGGHTEFVNWETSDGKIISLVGLASDFAEFDMIA